MALRLFIAEDSPAVLAALSTLIAEIDGVEIVGHAGHAPEALQLIRRMQPDVVILDISLATGNGIDVLRALRANDLKKPVIIMFTSQVVEPLRKACMNIGANHVFNKTENVDDLVGVLRALVF